MALNIVLYNPEIPQNTGNIMRTCAATNIKLHLIEPLGFSLEEKYLKRSAANYLEYTDYSVYSNWEDFTSKNKGSFCYLTRYGSKTPDKYDFTDTTKEYYIVLGAESCGIPFDILKNDLTNCVRYPMTENVRSLNLSNVACTVAYEALRQQDYNDLFDHEPDSLKGKDYLKNK